MKLYTISAAASALHVPVHRVQFAVKSRRIHPAALASRYRLWDEDGMELIRKAIAETDKSARNGYVALKPKGVVNE